jgi:hypothetical protein
MEKVTLVIGGNAYRVMEHNGTPWLWTGPVYADGRISESEDEWGPIDQLTDESQQILVMLRRIYGMRF